MRISDWSSDVCSSDLLTAYGFFRDFSLDLQLPGVSYCSLTIESLPTSEVLDDATLDPAPAGQASTLKVIQSTPVTGGMLLSSSVVENDYSEWSAATNYSAGSRVINAATHRIYESLIADNAGNDPAEIGRAHVCTPVNNAHIVCRLLIK